MIITKFFKSIISTIGKKEHKAPSEIEEWCLPDIVLIFASYIDEAEQYKAMADDLEKEENKK